MSGKKHHYVPRFYLKKFASDSGGRRINVFNIARRKLFSGVGLRDQCFRDRFYGVDRTEKGLAMLEARWASHLSEIVRTRTLPQTHSFDHAGLVLFISAQALRTQKSSDDHEKMNALMIDRIARGDRSIKDRLATGSNPPVLGPLRNFLLCAEMMDDLAARLIFAPEPVFVTSDHPAVRYNQYMESISASGTIGFAQRGLLVFVPLSPCLILMLFDSHVYSVPNPRKRVVERVSSNDIRQLNAIQALSAQSNLFVPNGLDLAACAALVDQVKAQRELVGPRIQEFGEDDNPLSSLLHTYFYMPSISLDLGFLRISHNAGRISMNDRLNLWRRPRAELDALASP